MPETITFRRGEEIDAERLRSYLGRELGLGGDEINIEQFPAGSSNLTYLVRVGVGEYVLRRPPFGNTVKSAHDMKRESEFLSMLAPIYPPAPKPLLYCADESVIGSEFFLMERRNGLVIRGRFPTQDAPLQDARISLCKAFIQNLADLHRLDASHLGPQALERARGYNRRQVEGWTKRYFAAKTDEWPHLETAVRWLNDSIPPEFGTAIIHNDYKFDNVMLASDDLTQIVAVLDWEMATVGDPLMDLGTTLGYWMSADAPDELLNMPFNPRALMENITRQELVEIYAAAAGRKLPDMLFYYVFGTFKIAVIAQQIYARYAKGFTKDKRFAGFGKFVAALGRIAEVAIEKRQI